MRPVYMKLLRILTEMRSPVTSQALATTLDVSVRSIKTYTKEINELYPGVIVSSRDGYTIDQMKYHFVLDRQDAFVPQTSEERVIYLTNRLLHGSEPLNLYDLSEEIFISYSTLKNDFKKMKKKLSSYDLTLALHGDYVSISGLEKNKRKLLSQILYDESSINFVNLKVIQDAFTTIDIAFIKHTVLEIFNEYHYFINDYSLINLVLHITIAIDRIRNHNINTQDVSKLPHLAMHEFELANRVISRLEEHYSIQYTDGEIYELTLLLISRATTIDYTSITTHNIQDYIGEDCLNLVKELIHSVSSFYYINLNEQEFFIRFALHIKNLLRRSKNNYFSKNPLAEGIKTSCPLIYDVSVLLASIIKQHTGIAINDDEIAYIAFHLGSTLEAQKSLHTKLSVLLYCPNYYDMNTRLLERINASFQDEILVANIITDESEFEKVVPPDLILTTIPFSYHLEIPVVAISVLLTSKDIKMIREQSESIKIKKKQMLFKENLQKLIKEELFEVHTKATTPAQTMKQMASTLCKLDYVEPSFLNELEEREKMSSTAFSLFALPHSMNMRANKTAIHVRIVKEPIPWSEKQVHLVLMLCFNRNDRYLFNEVYEPITMILSDARNTQQLITCTTYESFITTMASMLVD